MRYDTVVVGAGMGGLMSAALLRKRKPEESLLILESHTVSGGCASSYDRFVRLSESSEESRIRLDVGATTISGLESGQPLRLILDELKLSLPLHHADPGVRVVLADGTEIIRYADRGKWIKQCAEIFGINTIEFWNDIHWYSKKAWSVLGDLLRVPPSSFVDILQLVQPSLVRAAALVPSLFRPFVSLLKKHNLENDQRFNAFINQQLLISVQNTAEDVPLLLGALALDYASETYYIDGGLYALAQTLENSIVASGGEVRFKQRVVAIKAEAGGFEISTAKNQVFHAKRVISNLTIWDTPKLVQSPSHKFSRWAKRHENAGGKRPWGAIDLYGCIRDTIDDRGSLYHQLHEKMDDGSPYSVFLSLSRKGDLQRAPAGWRTLSCSTHEENPERWFTMTKEEEVIEREKARNRVEKLLHAYLPGYTESAKPLVEVATPYHFKYYTGRTSGRVGGIPHSLKRPLLFWPNSQTPIKAFFMVGDTIFPGQGTPAVAHGVRCLLDRIG
jgi:C-3',4' desaturase CrtD